MTDTVTIRDLRESKNISQDKAAEAAGLSYSKFVRIEEGSGRTTPEEVESVLKVLREMEPGTRKLAGRPFKDPAKQAAVKAARESGQSVAAVLGVKTPQVATGDQAPAKAKSSGDAQAMAKKAPARTKKAKTAPPADASPDTGEQADAGTNSVSSLLP